MAKSREQQWNPGEDLDVLMNPMEARLVGLVARLKERVMAVELGVGLGD